MVRWGRKTALPGYVNRTTYDVLRELTDDEMLIAVLTGQWGDNGVPPQRSSFLIHSLIAGKPAKQNQWGGATMDWTGPTPPPLYNFDEPPVCTKDPYDYSDIEEQARANA